RPHHLLSLGVAFQASKDRRRASWAPHCPVDTRPSLSAHCNDGGDRSDVGRLVPVLNAVHRLRGPNLTPRASRRPSALGAWRRIRLSIPRARFGAFAVTKYSAASKSRFV